MKRIPMLIAAACVLSAMNAHAVTPQQQKMKTCNAEATKNSLKGDDRKKFMSDCLSAKPSDAGSGMTAQQGKMKTCNADATTKKLKGSDRKKFMSECLKAPAAPALAPASPTPSAPPTPPPSAAPAMPTPPPVPAAPAQQ